MSPADQELTGRLRWLCRLRWLAASAIVALSLGARLLLGFPLFLPGLLALGVLVAMYNAILLLWMRASSQQGVLAPQEGKLLAHVQITLDLLALTAVIHYTGGVESPLGAYLVFHMIIASTLLSPLAAGAQATLASLLYGGLVFLEARGLLPHHSLGLFSGETYRGFSALLLALALISVLYAAIYLAGTIVQRLRQRESELSALTRRLAEQMTQAEASRQQVEEAQHMQLRYMYRVSHELRGPLSAAASLINVLAEGHAQAQPQEKTVEVLRRVSARLQQALDMVADLLVLSHDRQAPGEEQRTWVDLPTLMVQVADRLADRAAQARVTLKLVEAEGLGPLWAQREGLETALTNLAGNALKYTPPGGEVTLSALQDADNTRLIVTDNGMGIAEEDQPRIFEEFFRAPAARSRVTEGTGLGLSIVQSIVEAHGGRCTVDSRPGEGSTFTLHLPHRYPETDGG